MAPWSGMEMSPFQVPSACFAKSRSTVELGAGELDRPLPVAGEIRKSGRQQGGGRKDKDGQGERHGGVETRGHAGLLQRRDPADYTTDPG